MLAALNRLLDWMGLAELKVRGFLNHLSGFTVLAKTVTDVIDAAYERVEDFSKASPSAATASNADACYTKEWED